MEHITGKEDPRIRERAYAIWEQAGRPEGHHIEHWDQASREVAEEDAVRRPDRRKALRGRSPQGPTRELNHGPHAEISAQGSLARFFAAFCYSRTKLRGFSGRPLTRTS